MHLLFRYSSLFLAHLKNSLHIISVAVSVAPNPVAATCALNLRMSAISSADIHSGEEIHQINQHCNNSNRKE
jgi:hypothetical protein